MEEHIGIYIAGLFIDRAVVITWGIMGVLVGFSLLVRRSLVAGAAKSTASASPAGRPEGRLQVVAEVAVNFIYGQIDEILPGKARQVMPFIGTLWLFLALANLVGLIPGLVSPTGSLSVTAPLAILVFLSVHFYSISDQGLVAHLKHYLAPNPILLPFHIISEISRTLALAVRLFGNIMSLEMAALMVLMVAGFLVPVPILALHIIEALVQAYIFGVLSLIYIAAAQGEHAEPHPKE